VLIQSDVNGSFAFGVLDSLICSFLINESSQLADSDIVCLGDSDEAYRYKLLDDLSSRLSTSCDSLGEQKKMSTCHYHHRHRITHYLVQRSVLVFVLRWK